MMEHKAADNLPHRVGKRKINHQLSSPLLRTNRGYRENYVLCCNGKRHRIPVRYSLFPFLFGPQFFLPRSDTAGLSSPRRKYRQLFAAFGRRPSCMRRRRRLLGSTRNARRPEQLSHATDSTNNSRPKNKEKRSKETNVAPRQEGARVRSRQQQIISKRVTEEDSIGFSYSRSFRDNESCVSER